MEKQLVTVSYWLGLLSALLALGMRAFNVLGVIISNVALVRSTTSYNGFYKGALLFFLIAIATVCTASTRSEKTP